MKVDFIRFKTPDDVELQGWLSDVSGDSAAIHIHGMCGNGYENYFLDNLRQMYVDTGISFFSIDTRGRGIDNSFRQRDGWKRGGSCFEIFEESTHDIQGAIDYLRSIGKARFILQGHSLGCTKIINYLLTGESRVVEKVILLAPTDMVGWASTDPEHEDNLQKARTLMADNKNEELISAQCWPLDKTPLSAQSYLSKSDSGSAVDIYGPREDGTLLGRVEQPMLIVYGDKDIGITEIDGSVDRYIERVNSIKNANTEISVIPGASHGFRDYETQLSEEIYRFIS